MSETTPQWKKCTQCLLSGVGTRLKGSFLQGWVEHRAFELHVGCLLGLTMASEGVQPTNPPNSGHRTDLSWSQAVYICSQPWAAEVEGLQTCLYLSCYRRGALRQALCECYRGSEPLGGAHPCDYTECRTLIIPSRANTVITCQDRRASALC